MIYSYKITRDYGFAPNPFYGMCTLATCKPDIRRAAKVDDWVVGFGSASCNSELKGKMIYAMRVEKKITFDEYWVDPQYKCKKPVLNGSLKQKFGDNIYHKEGEEWKQADSHHSNVNGQVNIYNLKKDTKANAVLISSTFWYFGKNAIPVLPSLTTIIPNNRNFHKINGYDDQLSKWLHSFDKIGYIGEPAKFQIFRRYDGRS